VGRKAESSGKIVSDSVNKTGDSLYIYPSHRYFADQPLLAHPAITDRHLLLFAFEDWLKKWFFSILQILEVGFDIASEKAVNDLY
jgi:hypothetical protein